MQVFLWGNPLAKPERGESGVVVVVASSAIESRKLFTGSIPIGSRRSTQRIKMQHETHACPLPLIYR